MSVLKKILVAELEVQTEELQLEEIDVHEWDLYTKKMEGNDFYRMFYSGEGDVNSFTLAPHPTLANTKGYDQAELERQGWCYKKSQAALTDESANGVDASDVSINYFQLGGRKRSNVIGVKDASGIQQYGTVAKPACRKGPEHAAKKYENAYFIGRTDASANGDCKRNQNFWAEEVIMNEMESDLALSREHWTETSKHKIENELSFLTWGDCKINFSRDKASLVKETGEAREYLLLLVLVVVNAHPGVKSNHLNVHFHISS